MRIYIYARHALPDWRIRRAMEANEDRCPPDWCAWCWASGRAAPIENDDELCAECDFHKRIAESDTIMDSMRGN